MPSPVTISRRTVTMGLAVGAAVLAMPSLAPQGLAQSTDLASLGFPTIDVTLTATSFEGVPASLPAGRYLLTATIPAEIEFGAVAFLSPYGMGAADFIAAFGPPPAGPTDATPIAGEASPVAEGGEEGPLPAFIYQSRFAGGVGNAGGSTISAIIDLPEGDWVVWGEDPAAPRAPLALTVTGDFPDVTDPASDITVSLLDFEIWVNGNLTAGEHTFKVEHLGAQPHFFDLVKVPDGTTNDDVAAVIEAEMTGAEPPAGLNPETDVQEVAFTPTQSIDTATWHTITLETGTYAALCFFPRAGVGDPHALHGMHTVFTVS
jgi:hypothetical protein